MLLLASPIPHSFVIVENRNTSYYKLECLVLKYFLFRLILNSHLQRRETLGYLFSLLAGYLVFMNNAFQGFTVGRRHREECTLLEYFNSKLEVFLFVFHFMHLISNGMKVLLTSTTTSMNEQKPYAKRKIKKDSIVIVGNQKDLS